MQYFTWKLMSEINSSDHDVVARAQRTWDRNVAAYEEQLELLLEHFSEHQQQFWRDYAYHLHDGTVFQMMLGDVLQTNVPAVLPRLRGSGAAIEVTDGTGAWLYELKYAGIEAVDARLRGAAGGPNGTLLERWLYSELTREGPVAYRHSILFSTGSELSVVFKRFNYSRKKLPKSR
ncbi:MAG: hypothetical protein JW741_12685 [Sedimentisphaerales bacterium]|nr:hypothetical protein [Sedimentisphaerales bacterium]